MKLRKPKASKWVQVSETIFERTVVGAVVCDYDGYGLNAPTSIEDLKKMLDAFDPQARVAIYRDDEPTGNLALRIEHKETRDATPTEQAKWIQDRAREAELAALLQAERELTERYRAQKKVNDQIIMLGKMIDDLTADLVMCSVSDREDILEDIKTIQDEKTLQVAELNRLLNL